MHYRNKAVLILCISIALTACGGGGGGAPPLVADIVPARAANADGPRAAVLVDCVFSERNQACKLNELPLLGHDVNQPTIDDVMNRLVVSHDWMAIRFREILDNNPQITLKLSKGVTAIVIASNIRPSLYRLGTGAIYLDARYLWQTLAEKDSIDRREDERTAFGGELAHDILWRYVRNGDYAYRPFDWDSREPRSLEDTLYRASQVLLHELAHANDFFPPSTINSLNLNNTPSQAHRQVANQSIAPGLTNTFPKQSALLFELADVQFFGRQPSDAERQLQPPSVTSEFMPDGANDHYNFSTDREDVAMLAEEVLMKRYFDVDRDVAVTDNPRQNNPSTQPMADDYIVDWGQRGRIGDSFVQQRAQYVTDRLLPNESFASFYAALPPPQQMRAGESWQDNLQQGSGSTNPMTNSDDSPPPVINLPVD